MRVMLALVMRCALGEAPSALAAVRLAPGQVQDLPPCESGVLPADARLRGGGAWRGSEGVWRRRRLVVRARVSLRLQAIRFYIQISYKSLVKMGGNPSTRYDTCMSRTDTRRL